MFQPRRHLAPLFLLLLLLIATGCAPQLGQGSAARPDPGQGESESGAGKQGPSAAPAGIELPQSFSDPKTGLALRLPDLWTATPHEEAVVALISPQNGEEDFFLENVLVTADDQFKGLTMPAYLQALAAEVRKRYPDTQTVESGEIEIGGLMGHWLIDSFTGPKGPAQVYRVVLIREQVAYVLHGTAPVQSFDRYRPIFEAIARSVSWSEPKP